MKNHFTLRQIFLAGAILSSALTAHLASEWVAIVFLLQIFFILGLYFTKRPDHHITQIERNNLPNTPKSEG